MLPPSATNARLAATRGQFAASAHGATAPAPKPKLVQQARQDRPARPGGTSHRIAERQIDRDRIVLAAIVVVARKRAAQPHRLDPHDRIGLRIEIVGATERLDRDGVALDAVGRAAQRRVDDIAKEGDECGEPRNASLAAMRSSAARISSAHGGRPSICVRPPASFCRFPRPPGIKSSILMIVSPELSRFQCLAAAQIYCICNLTRIQYCSYNLRSQDSEG